MSKFMTSARRRNIMKAFIETQSGYFSLVWMLYGRQTDVGLNPIHETAMRVVYNYEESLFEELLGKDKLETMHQKKH